MSTTDIKRSRSRESSNAIGRIYIAMRHLLNRGFYKPMGISGKTLRDSLLELKPEIYGSIAEDRVELDGLVYIIERLPEGIEQCRYVNMTADEGLSNSSFENIIPQKRRRNCYRIDRDQMNIEITRGRSEIYDILTHLTFLFIESHKIASKVYLPKSGTFIREWTYLEDVVLTDKILDSSEKDLVIAHLSNILGRSFKEVQSSYEYFCTDENPNRFLQLIYWMGHLSIREIVDEKKRVITFSNLLNQQIGHHIYGEIWANTIKDKLKENDLIGRPIHIISANMHSVMNCLYAKKALPNMYDKGDEFKIYELLSESSSEKYQKEVKKLSADSGLIYVKDSSGTNINVQIIDTEKVDFTGTPYADSKKEKPVLIVMDYAFGEQAFETMDELLKPYDIEGERLFLDVKSVSIMGKAGILEGGKGDIMVPTAHIFEGTADNYHFDNLLKKEDLEGYGVKVIEGAMVSVLGTSLQNKDLLQYFYDSTWGVIGLEMEGAHYQKAIQAASMIRKTISKDIQVRYAYYASDNPLETGGTLASGGLGMSGVKSTYLITEKILKQIL
ncbi:MAG: hypothetical protein HRT66_04165 [Flavobacteriaceae bacterium]|nr:hypothetical protein [Flavobacteriaceae bacterium]